MTVHAAKGLEFPVVCVADLGRQPNARMPDLLVDGSRVGLRLMRLDGAGSSPMLAYEELCAERRRREAEEEDRILYVAMTRARELLVLSGSASFARWPRQGPGATPISWLGPAISEQLPQMLAEGELSPVELTVGPAGTARVGLLLNGPGAPALEDLPAGEQAREPLDGGGRSVETPVPDVRPAQPRVGRTLQLGAGAGVGRRPEATPPVAPARITTLSYSSLTELERCGYRYYLERVLGIGEDRAAARGREGEQGLEARARGTLVHRMMELLDFARPQPPSPAEVGECARELGLRVGAGEREELAKLIASSSDSRLAARIAAAKGVRREHPFAFSLGATSR